MAKPRKKSQKKTARSAGRRKAKRSKRSKQAKPKLDRKPRVRAKAKTKTRAKRPARRPAKPKVFKHRHVSPRRHSSDLRERTAELMGWTSTRARPLQPASNAEIEADIRRMSGRG